MFGCDAFTTVKLKPTKGVVKRYGDEFCNTVLTKFSRDYWLVALWITMYEDSKNNELAREILRAFIKCCINNTSRHIVRMAKRDVESNDVRTLLPDQLAFYNMVFSSGDIYKNMRRPFKDKLKLHSSEQSVGKMIGTLNLPDTINHSDSTAIFGNAGLADYSMLIRLSARYADTEEIKTITRAISMFLNNVHGKRKLQREIKTLIADKRG
jgi:outer membrane lipopolysaccharide assembly protein LptE/RlpB